MNDDTTISSPAPASDPTPLPASVDALRKSRNYEVGAAHARGGMGAILCAKDLNINRTVAMKVILPEREVDSSRLLRFVDEAKITGQLEHPNIVPVHELGVDNQGRPFYTMKFVMGVTLKQVLVEIKQGKPETLARNSLAHLLTIFQKTCDAVAFAHARGVVHRDLKPENIMLGEYGEVLVLDWGLAKVLRAGETANGRVGEIADSPIHPLADSSSTMAGTIMGTPQFMAPEQAEGQIDQIDAHTDIYSLGGILYNLLTLQPPVTADTVNEVLKKVRTGQIVPPNQIVGQAPRLPNGDRQPERLPYKHLPNACIPDSLSAVAMKAMALRREDRYQSVKELQLDIEAYQNGFATLAENASAWKQFTLFIKRNQAVSISVAASLLLLAGVSTAFTLRVIGERNRTTAERDRANATLAQLRGTAPTFHEQATALLDMGKLDDALVKIGYAIELVDQNADYRLFRANLLEATQRLADAAAEYRRVLGLRPADAAAKQNLALCERLLAENGGAATLRPEIQGQLVDALLAQQRKIEAAPLALLLGKGQDTGEVAIRARIKEYTSQHRGRGTRLIRLPNGMFSLDLAGLALGDLSLLKGLPIAELNLVDTVISDLSPVTNLPLTRLTFDRTKVTNLSPLRGMKLRQLTSDGRVLDLEPLTGMPLEEFRIHQSSLSDFSPLRGMPLKYLDVGYTKIRDLSPLAGMPLQKLDLGGTAITDISLLRGMPLESVNLGGCPKSIDLSPLAECPTLESIVLPDHPVYLAALRKLPKLHTISSKSAVAFWKEYDAAAEREQQRAASLAAARPENRYVCFDLSYACNADVINTASHKAKDGFSPDGWQWQTTSYFRKRGQKEEGLPDDGWVLVPNSDPLGFFKVRIPPGKNVILLTGPPGRQPQGVTVELPTTQRGGYSKIAVLHGGASGDGVIAMTVHYESGADDVLQLAIYSWVAKSRTEALAKDESVAAGTRGTAEMLAQTFSVNPKRAIKSLSFSFESCKPQFARDRFTAGIFAISALPASGQ